MFCPACGAKIQAGRFCHACGQPMSPAPPIGSLGRSRVPKRLLFMRSPTSVQPLPAAIILEWLALIADSIDHGRFEPGVIIDERYRVIGLLGRGGMGEVYRADDLRLGQPVALKFLPEGIRNDPVRLAQFHNEVRTARQVRTRTSAACTTLASQRPPRALSMGTLAVRICRLALRPHRTIPRGQGHRACSPALRRSRCRARAWCAPSRS